VTFLNINAMKSALHRTLLLLSIVWIPIAALSSTTEDERIGYWWYEDPVVKEFTEDLPETPLPPLPSPAELLNYHPQQLEKMLEERLDQAVWKGDPAAIKDYYIVQDIVRRKALRFTALSEFVMMTNPELNAKSQFHTTNAGIKQEKRVRQAQQEALFAKVKDDFALLVFTSPSCPYCPAQINSMRYFTDRHDWEYREINIDANPEAAIRFNITTTPVTVLVKRGENTGEERWIPVSVGLSPVVTVEENTYRGIRYLNGEITPQEFVTPEHQKGGFFDPTYTGY